VEDRSEIRRVGQTRPEQDPAANSELSVTVPDR